MEKFIILSSLIQYSEFFSYQGKNLSILFSDNIPLFWGLFQTAVL